MARSSFIGSTRIPDNPIKKCYTEEGGGREGGGEGEGEGEGEEEGEREGGREGEGEGEGEMEGWHNITGERGGGGMYLF